MYHPQTLQFVSALLSLLSLLSENDLLARDSSRRSRSVLSQRATVARCDDELKMLPERMNTDSRLGTLLEPVIRAPFQ